MLNCEYCDYLKNNNLKGQKNSKCLCELTGFVFHKEVQDYEMENHPCYDYPVSKLMREEKAELKLA